MSEAEPAVSSVLPVVVREDGQDRADGKGLFGPRDGAVAVRQVPVEALRESLVRTVGTLRSLFDEVSAGGGLPLKEAQVSFQITASGGIQLIGVGGQLTGSGAITLTFGG